MDGGAWQAVVHGVAKSRTRLSDFTFTFHFQALEKEMATHSRVLTWRIPGMGEPAGLQSGVAQSRTRLKWLSSSRDRVGFPEHYSRFSLIIHPIHSINSVNRTHSVLNCKAGRLSEEYMAQCPSASICSVWPLGFTLLPTPQTGSMRDMNPP